MAVEKLEIETYFGKCKCCLKFGYLRPMWEEHEDEKEAYGKMLTQCFSIPWTIESSEEEDQICEDCIWKLQEANKFKQQILQNQIREQKIEVENEEIKIEVEESYDVEYLDEELLHKNTEETDTNEQNGEFDADYLEDIEMLDDDIENDDDESYKFDEDEQDDEDDKDSKGTISVPRKRTPRTEDAGSGSDTPKPKWPKKLPLQERWKTYRQYTDENIMLAVDEVILKTMTQRQAALKYNVPAKTLSAKIKAIRKNEEFYLTRAKSSPFAAEMRTLLRYFNVTPFRNRASVFICYYCSERREFDSPENMRTHTRLCHPDQPDKIEMALRPPWNNELVKLDINDLKCIVCDQQIHTWSKIFTHLEENHSTTITCKNKLVPFDLETDNKCVLCTESFSSVTQLDAHMNKHYPNYICGSCGERFATLARYRAHERTHRTGKFPCKVCDKVFSLQKYMTKHVALKHMKVKKIKCHYCKEAFVTEYNRQAHIAKEHNEHVQIYTCEVCGESFDWLRTFSRHMSRRHSTQFYCKICSKSFVTNKALEHHNTIHNGDSYECPVCQRCYSTYNTLKSHVKFSHKNQSINVKGIFGIP